MMQEFEKKKSFESEKGASVVSKMVLLEAVEGLFIRLLCLPITVLSYVGTEYA